MHHIGLLVLIGILFLTSGVRTDCSSSAKLQCQNDINIVNNWINSPVYKEQNVTEMCRASNNMWSCLVTNNCSLDLYSVTRNTTRKVCDDLLSDNCSVFVQSDCAHDIHVVTKELNTTQPTSNNLPDFCLAYMNYWKCLSVVPNCTFKASAFKFEMDQICKNVVITGFCSVIQRVKCAENITTLIDNFGNNKTVAARQELCKAPDDYFNCLQQNKCKVENVPERINNVSRSCDTTTMTITMASTMRNEEITTMSSSERSSASTPHSLCAHVFIHLLVLLISCFV